MNKLELVEFLRKKGFAENIISAIGNIEREKFIPEHTHPYAYDDMILPIEPGTTLSRPSTTAFILTLLNLKDNQKILEIGSGTGYLLALISELCPNSEVYGIEINKKFAVSSKKTLENNRHIHILNKNGLGGIPELAPFDKIVVSASFKNKPYKLISQLTDSGTLVSPVNDEIICIEKSGTEFKETAYSGFSFVSMLEEDK